MRSCRVTRSELPIPHSRQRVTYICRRPVPLKQAIGEIKSFLISTVTQRAGPAARTRLDGAQLDLAPPVQGMADKLPVKQVCRRVDCASREVLERRGAQEIGRGVVAYSIQS